MNHPTLDKVLANRVSDSDKLHFLTKVLPSLDTLEDTNALYNILQELSYSYLNSDSSAFDVAETFLKLGQDNPTTKFIPIYFDAFEAEYYFREQDLDRLIQALGDTFAEVPEIARFGRKLIKEEKVRKKS